MLVIVWLILFVVVIFWLLISALSETTSKPRKRSRSRNTGFYNFYDGSPSSHDGGSSDCSGDYSGGGDCGGGDAGGGCDGSF